jgi:hypothetical protein
MSGALKGAIVKRASGESVSPPAAALAAIVAAGVAAVITYRVLRS